MHDLTWVRVCALSYSFVTKQNARQVIFIQLLGTEIDYGYMIYIVIYGLHQQCLCQHFSACLYYVQRRKLGDKQLSSMGDKVLRQMYRNQICLVYFQFFLFNFDELFENNAGSNRYWSSKDGIISFELKRKQYQIAQFAKRSKFFVQK